MIPDYLKINIKHYHDGCKAFHNGVKLLECPFMNNAYTRDAMLHWYEGWSDEEMIYFSSLNFDTDEWEN